jgi:hypothetical protein
MKRVSVDSAVMCSVGYDAASELLEVEFRNGSVYRYFDVPRDHYDAFLAATSKGKFFNAHVRPAFHFTRVA